MAEPLSQREFDTWRTTHDANISRLIRHIETQAAVQTEHNLKTEGRVTALEVNQTNAGKLSAKVSGIMAAVLTAVINGVFLLAGGHR